MRGLLVDVAGVALLLPLPVVQEVLPTPPSTPLPQAVPDLIGVVALRGRVLPLWRTAGLLALDGTGPGRMCVRLDVDGVDLALLVDGVDRLRTAAAPQAPGATAPWWVAGTVQLDLDARGTTTATVLDPVALLERVGGL